MHAWTLRSVFLRVPWSKNCARKLEGARKISKLNAGKAVRDGRWLGTTLVFSTEVRKAFKKVKNFCTNPVFLKQTYSSLKV